MDEKEQLKQFTKYLKELLDTAKLANPTLDTLKNKLTAAMKGMDAEMAARVKNAKSMTDLLKVFDTFENDLIKLSKLNVDHAKTIKDLRDHIRDEISDRKEQAKLNMGLNKQLNDRIAADKRLAAIAKQHGISLKEGNDAMAALRRQVGANAQLKGKLNKIEKETLQNLKDQANAYRNVINGAKAVTDEFMKTAKVVDYFGKSVQDASNAATNFVSGLTATAGLTKMLAGLKQGLQDFDDLRSKSLGGAFVDLSFSAVKLGLSLKTLTELVQQNHRLISKMGGGAANMNKYIEVINNAASNFKQYGSLEQRNRAAATAASIAQISGVDVNDTEALSGSVNGLMKEFTELAKITGESIDVIAQNRHQMLDMQAVQSNLLGLSEREAALAPRRVQQEYEIYRAAGLNHQQTLDQIRINKEAADTRKMDPLKRMTQTIHAQNALTRLMKTQGGFDQNDIKEVIRVARGGQETESSKLARDRIAKARAQAAIVNPDDNGISQIPQLLMDQLGGELLSGVYARGEATAIQAQKGMDLTGHTELIKATNTELAEANKWLSYLAEINTWLKNFSSSSLGSLLMGAGTFLAGLLTAAFGKALLGMGAKIVTGLTGASGMAGVMKGLGTIGAVLMKGLGAIGAGLAGWEIGSWIDKNLLDGTGLKELMGDTIATMLGQGGQVMANRHVAANATNPNWKPTGVRTDKPLSPSGGSMDAELGMTTPDIPSGPITGRAEVKTPTPTPPLKTPQGRAAGLDRINFGAFQETVKQRESGGNYQIVNSKGYAGAYQFGAQALESVGLLKPGTYAKYKSNAAMKDDSNWTGGLSLEKFLNNPKLQDDAFRKLTQQNMSSLEKQGAISSSTSSADLAGGLMAAHLGGSGNAANFMKTGAGFNDAFGTSISSYFDKGRASQVNNPMIQAANTETAQQSIIKTVPVGSVNTPTASPTEEQMLAVMKAIAKHTEQMANNRGRLGTTLPTQQASVTNTVLATGQ